MSLPRCHTSCGRLPRGRVSGQLSASRTVWDTMSLENRQPSANPQRLSQDRAVIGMSLLLAAATLVTFWPMLHHDFINLDDHAYVTDNLRVQRGLNAENFVWAFGHVCTGNWHPLTMLSHMLDCQWFGLN